jgi:hypothetical protein
MLGILLLIVAVNAFGGGYYGMSGAPNVPVEWLRGSPFKTYFIPALILFFGVGGISLIASILVFTNHAVARKMAFYAGVIIMGWLITQVIIIGYVSWMQPATAVAAILILVLVRFYPNSQQ